MYDRNQEAQQRRRADTVYDGNDPSHGQVDQQGHGVAQRSRRPLPPTPQQPVQRDRAATVYGGNDPSHGAVDQQGHAISQNGSASNAPNVAWTGKFVSAYGGYADSNQGLLFKRTDGGDGGLHHFTPAQAQQLRASNNDLIKESMQNGSQGKDVKVTFSVDHGRGSWGVQPLEQSQARKSHG